MAAFATKSINTDALIAETAKSRERLQALERQCQSYREQLEKRLGADAMVTLKVLGEKSAHAALTSAESVTSKSHPKRAYV